MDCRPKLSIELRLLFLNSQQTPQPLLNCLRTLTAMSFVKAPGEFRYIHPALCSCRIEFCEQKLIERLIRCIAFASISVVTHNLV
jgi:hypothetical protein